MIRLDGKRILVGEAASVEGATIVRALRAAGATTAIGTGEGAIPSLDLGSAAGWNFALNEVERRFGPLNALVCNAAEIDDGDIEALDRSRSRTIRSACLDQTMLAMRAVMPRLRRRPGSSIVIVSSIAGEIGFAEQLMACATAAAQRAMVKSAAVHAREKGYDTRVNIILAGFAAGTSLAAAMPRGVVSSCDVAATVAFLLSDAAKGVTGAEITVDAGGSIYPA